MTIRSLVGSIWSQMSTADQTKLHEVVTAWRETTLKEIEAEIALVPFYRETFGENYGNSGLRVCEFADHLAAATIENSYSRKASEMPFSTVTIKYAILDTSKLAIENNESDTTIELLKAAYISVAKFLADSEAEIVTERARGYLSENPNHPSFKLSAKADEIENRVVIEQHKLGNEFGQFVLEYRQRMQSDLVETFRRSAEEYEISSTKLMEVESKYLIGCKRFGDGYGFPGRIVLEYVETALKGTVENFRSRSITELTEDLDGVKHAILDVAGEAYSFEGDEEAVECLRFAYSYLARFLPEERARLVTKCNVGLLSKDHKHQVLTDLEEDKVALIESEIEYEEHRLKLEFDETLDE